MLFKLCLLLLLQSAYTISSDYGHYESKPEILTLELLSQKIENLEAQQRNYEEDNRMQQVEIEMLKSHQQEDKETIDILLKNKLTARTRRQNESPVAFYGKMINEHVNVSQNPVLFFNNVVTNIGNPYSQNNGLFIATVPGIYVFSTTVMTETGRDAHVGIFVNDKRMTNIKLFGSEHMYDTMSQTAVFNLQQHDTVCVRHYQGDTVVHFDYTSFSGFLLQEDYGQLQGTSIIG